MKRFFTFSLLVVTVVLAVLTPALALAQDTTPAAPSLLERIISPAGLGGAAAAALGLVGTLSWLTGKRKKLVALATYYAFHIVEDIGNEKEGDDGFDKAAKGLEVVNQWMVANGWRPLKPGEAEVAKLGLQALHGAEVAKVKVAIAAAEAAPVPS